MLLSVVRALEVIVGSRVGRKPVLTLKIFAESFEHCEGKLRSIACNLAHELAETLHDDEILIVHPNYPVE